MTTSGHKKNIEAVYSLSPMQEGMLFHSLYEPDEGFYFEQFVCTLRGDLNTEAFERTWNHIIDRHPILRTSFVWKSLDQMLQVVHRQVTLPFTHLDWRQNSPADQELLLTEYLNAERHGGFDLSKAPLIRLALIRTEDKAYNFVWCYHHALLDGWSQPLLLNEFIACYEAFSRGSELNLGPVRPYRNYIDWIKSQDISKAESFWRQTLEGFNAPTPLVVNRKPGAEVSIGEHLEIGIHLSESTTQKLLSLGSQYQLTINTFVLGAWAALLARYSGQSDVLFGVTVSGRPAELPGSNQMVGLFINTLPMRVQTPAEGTVISWLQALQAYQVELRQYEHSPLVKIQDWSDVPGGIPLFESILIFENYPVDVLTGKSDRALEIENVRISERANYPLNLVAALGQDLFIKLVYDSRIFDEHTIHRMLGNLETLLESIASDPEQQVNALPLLTQAERQQVLVDWNDTAFTYPQNRCIHHLFEAQAVRTPNAVAVIFNEMKLTYEDLNYRANQVAHYLRDMGVGPETLVGIFLDRSLSLVVGILGILKAGGAYVPLDVSYPADRLSLMLSNAQLPVLLSEDRFVENLPENSAKVVLLDDPTVTEVIGSCKSDNPDSGVNPGNLAYMIYTSGSTGEPKGVMLEHSGLVNLALSQIEAFDITPGDRVLQFASIGFDASVSEIFTTLVSGASLYLAGREILSSPPDLVELLQEAEINIVTLPPSLLQVMPSHELPAIKTLVSAGEKCSWEITERWSHIPRLINAYGPTEATVGPTYYLLEDDQIKIRQESSSVPIGRPISNIQLYILDEQLRPVPVGVPGELHIGGTGLARGYLNQPEQTKEKFIHHALDSMEPIRLYKTGDLVRYLPDGNVEYLGRVDHQVKVRGFRIELEEIESVLIQHPSVQNAVVVAQTDETGDNKLIAYVLSEHGENQDVAVLRRFLRSKLPGYMVPALFILLPDLPLTKSGKVDRNALPSPDGAQTGLEDNYIAPQTPHQELLAGIFSLILGVKPIGIDDDFFELGGHSLLVTRLVSRIRKAFQVELNLRDVFEAPTVRSLADIIQAASQKEDRPAPPPITPSLRGEVLPLSFAQQRLWFLDQLLPGNAFYNLPTALRLSGDLKLDALVESVNEVVKRHESLRTTFILDNGEPYQKISPTLSIPFPLVDLSQESQPTRDRQVRDWIVEEARKPFDLSQGPLLRAQILRTSPDEHIILFTMHHIIADGWSMRVLISEIAMLYQAFMSGQPSPLPELLVQYADFTVWQRNWLQGETLEKHKEYWKSQLADSPSVLELPTDRPRSAVQSSRGAHLSFKLPPDLSTSLREYAHQEGATLFMMLLSAFMTLLYRYSGQTDINVGTPIANRTRNEIEGLIGFFVNTLVMRADLSGNPSFRDFLHRMREIAFEAYAHQDLPFETLVEMLQPVRDMSHSPLFQVMFTLDNVPTESITLPGLTLSALDAESGTSKFDLTLSIQDGLDALEGNVEYNSDLFDRGTIDRIVTHYQVLLESIVGNPNQRISGLPILNPSEQTRMLVAWNDTVAPFASDKCFHHLFEQWVKHSPDALALRFGADTLTYAELNSRANQLANFLRSLGVGPETLVGVCLERSLELVVSLLGVWKAGGAYIPLDPEYPEERLAYMLSDSRVAVLVTQEHLRERLAEIDISVISIDRDWDQISQYSHDQPLSGVIPANLAYVIYTSGSTGIPKGVQLAHTGLCNVVAAQQAAFKVGPGDRVLQFSSLSFDAATFELVMGLGTGATLCLAQRESLLPGRDLLATLEETAATIVVFPPSALNVLPDGDLPALRVITVAGEACPAELVERWAPGRQFFNLYGPTEDTIWATFAACLDGKVKPPIGRPIFNNQVYILDGNGEPVPVGVAGELFIGGVGVARGYLGKPGLTAERFVPNPYGSGDRLYRTGDIARYQVDGKLEFVGREDDQVKVRGFRIELGEIEVALQQLPEVQEVVVMTRSDQPGEPRLVAYIVPATNVVPDPTMLRQALARKLPNYMVPGIFVNLERLPLLPSGKVDRTRLPSPEGTQQNLDTEYVQPRNELEKILVEMWQKIIRVDQIGVNDNFFELGGDSIRGAVFINQLEKVLGESIYVAALFEAQTISELANYLITNYPTTVVEKLGAGSEVEFDFQSTIIKNGKSPVYESVHPSMVPIQSQGSKHPLFCVHSAGGVVFPYYNLVPYLGNDQPLYGVQDPSYVQMDKSFSRLEDMAAYYVEGLQKVQPSGPYHIAGWSSGGVMAFEMAQQLSRQGEKVAFLGIIDFRAPGQFVPSKRQRHLDGKGNFQFGHFHMVLKTLRVLPNMVKEFLTLLKSALSYTRDGLYLKYKTPNQDKTGEKPTLIEYIKWFWISAWRSSFLEKSELAKAIPRDSDLLLIELPTVRHVLGRVGEDIRLTRKYVPEVYDGKITVLSAGSFEADEGGPNVDPTMGWDQLTEGEVEVRKIPGNHMAVLRKPYVESFAQIIKDCLDQASKEY